MLEKLMCIISFTIEASLQQIINTKMHTKIACSSRVVVKYFIRKTFQFYKGYFINFTILKSLKIKLFCKILESFATLV